MVRIIMFLITNCSKISNIFLCPSTGPVDRVWGLDNHPVSVSGTLPASVSDNRRVLVSDNRQVWALGSRPVSVSDNRRVLVSDTRQASAWGTRRGRMWCRPSACRGRMRGCRARRSGQSAPAHYHRACRSRHRRWQSASRRWCRSGYRCRSGLVRSSPLSWCWRPHRSCRRNWSRRSG